MWQGFAEGLTATHHQVFFDQARTKSFIQQLTFCKPNVLEVVKKHGVELSNGERGSPENTGLDFKASQ